jgi:hypothetical protein
MKVQYLIGIAAIAGGGAWLGIRTAERKKLTKLLAESPQLRAIGVLNQAFLAAGDTRYANYTPETLSKGAIKLTNTISAKEAYRKVLDNLPTPKELDQKEGILTAGQLDLVADAIKATTGLTVEEAEEGMADILNPDWREDHEGRVPDWVPVIGTQEKADYWKSWFGNPYSGVYIG